MLHSLNIFLMLVCMSFFPDLSKALVSRSTLKGLKIQHQLSLDIIRLRSVGARSRWQGGGDAIGLFHSRSSDCRVLRRIISIGMRKLERMEATRNATKWGVTIRNNLTSSQAVSFLSCVATCGQCWPCAENHCSRNIASGSVPLRPYLHVNKNVRQHFSTW